MLTCQGLWGIKWGISKNPTEVTVHNWKHTKGTHFFKFRFIGVQAENCAGQRGWGARSPGRTQKGNVKIWADMTIPTYERVCGLAGLRSETHKDKQEIYEWTDLQSGCETHTHTGNLGSVIRWAGSLNQPRRWPSSYKGPVIAYVIAAANSLPPCHLFFPAMTLMRKKKIKKK